MYSKSSEREKMEKIVRECKNCFESIKLSSLSQESKERLIKVLTQERRERFGQLDYLGLLDSQKEGERIPKLHEITLKVATDADVSLTDFENPSFCEMFIEQINICIKEEYGKIYEKKMPKNLQDLKKALIPFDVTDKEFLGYLILGKPELLNYHGQELHLGLSYRKLLLEKKRIENQIKADTETESKELIEKNEEIKELENNKKAYKDNLNPDKNHEIGRLQQKIHELNAMRPNIVPVTKAEIARVEIENYEIDKKITPYKKEISELEAPIISEIKNIEHRIQAIKEKIAQECEDMYIEKYGYYNILEQLKSQERLAFEEAYPHLNELYQDDIIKRGITK